MDIRRLRLITVLGPILFILLLELIGIILLGPALGENALLRLLVIFAILITAVVPFSSWVFATIQRQQQDLMESYAEAERTREIERHSRETTLRVFQAQEDERKRIARELHDDTAQSLSTLMIAVDLLEPSVPEGDMKAREAFERIRMIARRALDEVRALSHDLRPTILDDFGLEAALRWYADEYTATFGVPVDVRIASGEHPQLAPEVELALFRIAQEALTNSGKHAEASRLTLSLAFRDDHLQLSVEDDGRGFDSAGRRSASRQGGLGLYGMRERAELIGGTLIIESSPGSGTKVITTVPVPRETPLAAENGATPC